MNNVDMKSLISIWDHLAMEFNIPQQDRNTFRRRAINEGIKFLTVTLPSLGKAIDAYLTSGNVPDFTNVRFKLRDGIPVFLNELIERVLVGIATDSSAVWWDIKIVRQLTLLYYKLEVPFDEEVHQLYCDEFKTRDRELTDIMPSALEMDKVAKLLKRVLCNFDPFSITPKHGGGAVSNRLKNKDKYHQARYIPRLDASFPYTEHFFYNASHLVDCITDSGLPLEVVEEPPSRLVFVPKDSRGPRIICCEPSEFQYIQQGIMIKLYDYIQSPQSPLTMGYVNFSDQDINRDLVVESSISKKYSTLDLSEASDRVSWHIVQEVFPTHFVRALDACRSRYITFPDGSTFGPLAKFAPMGSALCFPVEALYFWAILKGTLDIDVWVYGDDIILPREYHDVAITQLEAFGLKVNVTKSCSETHFRESCGQDCWYGNDVGYIKYRQLPTSNIESRSHDVSFLTQIGLEYGSHVGRSLLSTFVDRLGPIPVSSKISADYCYFDPLASRPFEQVENLRYRYNATLQRREVKTLVASSRSTRNSYGSHWNELLRKVCVERLDNDKFQHLYDDQLVSSGRKARDECSYTERHTTTARWKWMPI